MAARARKSIHIHCWAYIVRYCCSFYDLWKNWRFWGWVRLHQLRIVGLLSQLFYYVNSVITQQTGDVEPMLVWCWASVCDAGPPLHQHWFKSCVCWVLISFVYLLTKFCTFYSHLLDLISRPNHFYFVCCRYVSEGYQPLSWWQWCCQGYRCACCYWLPGALNWLCWPFTTTIKDTVRLTFFPSF